MNYLFGPVIGPLWTYYEYLQGEIPEIEDALLVDAAEEIFGGTLLDVQAGDSNPSG